MNNNKTENSAHYANTVIPIAPMYDGNASNGNGGNRNFLDLTGNTQVVEGNHIGQNTHKNYISTLADIMVLMVDNMPEKCVETYAVIRTNEKDMGLLSETRRKQRKFLKSHCKLLLDKMNCSSKKTPIKLEGAGCLMYNSIVEFMGTKISILNVNIELEKNYVNGGATDVLTRYEDRADLEARMDVAVRLGDSTSSAIQSAIYFLYHQSGI